MVSWFRSKFVGKGSFGTVSLAVDKFDGRVFAVKSVEQSMGLSCQIESLENEIRILRSLRSPYVVGFLGDDVTYESPSTSYRNLHMEYLPGGTVAASEAYSGEKLLQSRTWCIVSALSYLHNRGIVHCDVKGRNILIGENPSFVKLADFGSAVEFPGEGSGASIVPRGSPLWMAPEVIRGESQGPESDIWSLGCTVIEMITGKPAWDDIGFGADTLSRIGYSRVLPEIPSRLSETGRDFLEKCLRRDPSRRWTTHQLLQHPFLASAEPKADAESSPRCVLDWVHVDFEDEFEESKTLDSVFLKGEFDIRGRIGKLSTNVVPNWESDGWWAVRSLENEGTISEYTNLTRLEVEITGTSSEYSRFREDDFGNISLENSNHGAMELPERCFNKKYLNLEFKCGGEAPEGGSSERCEITTITSCLHSMKLILHYWLILIAQLILFVNYMLYPFFPLCLKFLFLFFQTKKIRNK